MIKSKTLPSNLCDWMLYGDSDYKKNFNKKIENSSENKNEIDSQFQLIEEAMDARMNSIMNQIKDIFARMKNDLKTTKTELKYVYNNIDVKIKCYQDDLDELKQDIVNFEWKKNQRHHSLTSHDKIDSLRENLQKLETMSITPEAKLMRSPTGCELYNAPATYATFTKPFEEIFLDDRPLCLCVLPDDRLVCTNEKSIKIFDKNMKLVQEDTKHVRAYGVALSRRNQLYVTDYMNNLVILMDLYLNKIKCISGELNSPHGICCDNDFVYVCDSYNKRIQIYDLNLTTNVSTIKLDYEPFSIKIIGTTIGVYGYDSLHFYDKCSKLRKAYHDIGKYGALSDINCEFNVICHDQTLRTFLYRYDKDGVFQGEYQLRRLDNFISKFHDGHMVIVNKKLMMTCGSKMRLFRF